MAELSRAAVLTKHKDLTAFLRSQVHAWDAFNGAKQTSLTEWRLFFDRQKWLMLWETRHHRLTAKDFDEWLAGVQRQLEDHWPAIRWSVN